MEKRGQVNQYSPYKPRPGEMSRSYFTINLADGVTPFMMFFGGREHSSQCYRLRPAPDSVLVTHAWYRPTREEFDGLSADMQDHVLNGGLCFAELGKARQLPDDPVEAHWGYESFQAWCLGYYGKRRPPLPSP